MCLFSIFATDGRHCFNFPVKMTIPAIKTGIFDRKIYAKEILINAAYGVSNLKHRTNNICKILTHRARKLLIADFCNA